MALIYDTTGTPGVSVAQTRDFLVPDIDDDGEPETVKMREINVNASTVSSARPDFVGGVAFSA